MTTPDQNQTTQSETTTREREVIVTNGDGRNNYAGVIVAILAIIVFGVLGYMFIGAMGDGGDGSMMPDEVNVNLDSGSSGGGESGGSQG